MRHDEKEISKKILQALKKHQKPKVFDKSRLFFSAFLALLIVVFFVWESQPRINISKLKIQHNVSRSSGKNIKINFELKTAHLENNRCNAVVYFYYKNGRKVRSTIPGYKTKNNQLSIHRSFRPTYQYSIYRNYTLYMPNKHFDRENYQGKVTAYCGNLWANRKKFNFTIGRL
ncbi:MAG: hypothetical protein HLUCCO16_08920 [Phormidium sp. OSCR]|nr:MAG: hypothetical protein HLUCCO16_08920 [Phormidium sp. OSCR]